MTVPPALARLAPAYLARLVAPAGLGDLVPADLAGEVGSVVGGGGVRVMLRVAARPGAAPRATALAFRSLGSPSAHGPGAVLVERGTGATLDDLAALRRADLLAPLGPVPPAVERAADRCLDALDRALTDGAAAARTDAPGLLTCRCLGVGDREIRRAVARGATTVPMIGLDCAAGTGCHSCWPDLRALLLETTTERTAPGPRVPPPPTAPPTAPPSLHAAIRALVAPLWHAQGVTLGEVATDGGAVRLTVAATAPDAMASPIGAVALAQHALRETMDEAVRVVLGDAAPR
ncbi:MAG: (2Fe-2S)-binding protein [Planctomycetia bacterium]|nr:(2Fe-2S)-binding protein [Planctomycetia bacterium]